MTVESDETLDGLLCRWHQWQGTSIGKGWHRTALVVGEYRTSRQYDDANGALDDHLDTIQMRAVEIAVQQMMDPYKAAIYCLARALTVGCSVFMSPRLPVDADDRAAIVCDARAMLTRRLQSAGVM